MLSKRNLIRFRRTSLVAAHKAWQRVYGRNLTKSEEFGPLLIRSSHGVFLSCFPSYVIWLTSQIIKSVRTSKSVNINQSIGMNQFYSIEASNFIIIQYLQLT